MFQVIVLIISIVLAVLLAAGVVVYSGQTVTQAGAQSQGARVINEGSQIRAASLMYQSTQAGSAPTALSQLQSANLLQSIPQNWYLTPAGDAAYTAVTGEATCQQINTKYGYAATDPIPSCSSVGAGSPVCCGP